MVLHRSADLSRDLMISHRVWTANEATNTTVSSRGDSLLGWWTPWQAKSHGHLIFTTSFLSFSPYKAHLGQWGLPSNSKETQGHLALADRPNWASFPLIISNYQSPAFFPKLYTFLSFEISGRAKDAGISQPRTAMPGMLVFVLLAHGLPLLGWNSGPSTGHGSATLLVSVLYWAIN